MNDGTKAARVVGLGALSGMLCVVVVGMQAGRQALDIERKRREAGHRLEVNIGRKEVAVLAESKSQVFQRRKRRKNATDTFDRQSSG